MCDTCGCGSGAEAVLCRPGAEKGHVHDHGEHDHQEHYHHHPEDHRRGRKIEMEQDVMLENNLLAERNRGYFEARHVLALNFLSSPGSGKTALLERTIPHVKERVPVAVIEGDQQTTNDADRIHALGVPVIQVNTGTGCHLDALMINRAVKELELQDNSLLCIENVGNLVCPAMFDLGEALKVVVISVTEGEDKPLKYPYMFHEADVCILNKTDLLPYLEFDVARCRENAMQVSHDLEWFEMSVKTGEGLEVWLQWLESQLGKR